MSEEQVNIQGSELIAAISIGLDSCFFKSSREQSKGLFKEISEGKEVNFIRFQTANGTEVDCYLALDATHYDGKLNFSKFRKSTAIMMLAVKQQLDNKESVNMLSSGNGDVLFNVPGLVKTGDVINVMVSGFRQLSPGKALVRLMYLDPKDYIETVQRAREKNTTET